MWEIAWETFGTNRKRWITFFIAYWKLNKIFVTILESCGTRYQRELQSVTGFSSWIRKFLKFLHRRIEFTQISSPESKIGLHYDFLMSLKDSKPGGIFDWVNISVARASAILVSRPNINLTKIWSKALEEIRRYRSCWTPYRLFEVYRLYRRSPRYALYPFHTRSSRDRAHRRGSGFVLELIG